MLPDICTYTIGDVHGRADLLKAMLTAIDVDAEQNDWTPRIIFLGDIIDHGPNSRSAMDLVCRTLKNTPDSRLILGNHDNFLLEFMTGETMDAARFGRWLDRVGGYETFLSYGLEGFRSLDDIAAYFREEYADHLEVLQNADRMIVDRKFAFVHAGIDPDLPLDQQSERDLMWIRDKFLDFDGPLPHLFVHGHTPSPDYVPVVKSNRIGIDTWAFRSNILTSLAVSPSQTELSFIVVDGSTGEELAIRKIPVPSSG
ncbi:serine/threonine protein phosphatase 1 [Phyllobacterium trifolii]|uniref:Serine/threonine protein phosphatase 1 n=1 Tax=Phyllobacterium trifolii TaxID=300193 RepID=A0A839U6Y8_9HYPH|nr:metallophosphoesterase [Phyllobacterium trifolii]MBB3146906.1 serine/threonine protein phosphatase 1 [Phyllobacterium trifolii]